MRRRFIRIVMILGLLAALVPTLTLQPAAAAGVVGNGNAASCTEAAFDAALAGGGLVTFDCGPGLITINLTTEKVIANDTQIDGTGNAIVLDMNANARHFYVAPPATLRLDNIRLEDGSVPGDGGLIYNDGTVIATNAVFSAGRALGLGGAIRNEGTFIANGGTFTANFSDLSGGALFNGSAASTTISGDTLFISNRSDFGNGGGIANRGGTVQITGSVEFDNNVADNGGAIGNAQGGNVSVNGTTFSGNDATADGGAIHNANGTVSVSNTTFFENGALNSGGAFSQNALLANISSITDSWFDLNTAGFQGGAVHNESRLSVTGTEFTFNHADGSGGAINNAFGANLIVTRSSLIYNDADSRGGGIRNGGTATVETSTVSNNTADDQGGGIVNQDGMAINNSTIAFNDSGAPGGGIRNAAAGTLTVTNSIVSDNTGGGDCSNAGAGTFTSGNHNLDSDTSCPFGMANDISGGNANLQTLDLNGGTTDNHLPGPGSDAIDNGPVNCTSPDQRGEVRPQNGVCDIGAVEVIPPADVCANLQTGLLQAPTAGECNGPFLRKIVFEDNGPHYLCRNISTGLLSYSYAPTCQPYNIPAIVMPDAAPLAVCLNFSTKRYRQPLGPQPCVYGEFATVLQ